MGGGFNNQDPNVVQGQGGEHKSRDSPSIYEAFSSQDGTGQDGSLSLEAGLQGGSSTGQSKRRSRRGRKSQQGGNQQGIM